MANKATIGDTNGLPATFAGSKTGRDKSHLFCQSRRRRAAHGVGRMGRTPRWTGPLP